MSASWNSLYGANLDTAAGSINTGTISILSTLGRWNYFSNNAADIATIENYGLRINTFGAVTINNTEVAHNAYYGIDLRNDAAGLGAPVTMNSVYVTENGDYGVYALTSGAFTWNYGSSSGNEQISLNLEGFGGLYLENQVLSKPVIIKGVNFDENAQGNGLEVFTMGAITLNQVSANENTLGYGAWLKNSSGTGGVTLLGAGVNGNEFFNNYNYGLRINTNGAVTITNIDAGGNGEYGAHIDTSSPLGVSILSASPNWVNTFHGNIYDGLAILTPGNIKLVNVQASGNNGRGAFLDNCLYEYNGEEDVCTGFGSITLSSLGDNTNIFNENQHGGIFADSWGNITLANITASGSTIGNGVDLDNQWKNSLGVASIGNITINNLVQRNFSYNVSTELEGYGLWAASNGTITVKGVHADGNGMGGVYLNNWNSPLPKAVTVSNSSFYNTHNGRGLEVYSWGKITLSNVYAYGNDVC